MSYDLTLQDPITLETLCLDYEHFMRGGTYCTGGTKELWLNVTYNYGPVFCKTTALGEDGISRLNGITGAESIPILEQAVAELSDDVDPDYWKATEGNAKRALLQLLAMARMRSDGVWKVD